MNEASIVNEESQVPLSEEEVADLDQQVERGKQLGTMLETPGWELLREYINIGKQNAIQSWLKENDPNARQAVLTLDGLQAWILNTVKTGQAAYSKLHPRKSG